MILDTRLGNTPRRFVSQPRNASMRVPEEIRQCVVYLGLPGAETSGRPTMIPRGTAFFVSVPYEVHNDLAFIYVITAKHVAKRLEGREFLVRANTTAGGSVFVRSGEQVVWWYHHSDESVDVAAFAWAPPKEIEHKLIPTSMLLTDEVIRDKKIGTGDEVFMTGLFVHLAGSERNLPIVRMGNIAMMPGEAVPTSMGNIEAYLIEARSIGGLSGSPAFVRETIPSGIGAFYLLGLMHGHWDIPPEGMHDETTADAEEATGRVNMGIAIVVPAKKILEVLNQPRLVEGRRQEDERIRRERQPTFDEAMERREDDKPQATSEGLHTE